MKLAILHGPNLNLLGTREPEIYGTDSLADINIRLVEYAKEHGVVLECFQYNGEGEMIGAIHRLGVSTSGIVINPGGYAHTSVAIRDAISGISVPVIEVHLSNIAAREAFRQTSLTAGVCRGVVSGLGWRSYLYALMELMTLAKTVH